MCRIRIAAALDAQMVKSQHCSYLHMQNHKDNGAEHYYSLNI